MQQAAQPQGWTTASWGFWGWLETILKLIGIVFGLIAFVASLSEGTFTLGGNPRLAAIIVLGLLTLASVGIIALRYQQREITSMAFAVVNALGHLGLLIALLRLTDQPILAVLFGVFYVLGGLVKLRFLAVTGFTEPGQTPQAMLRFNWVINIVYALFVIFMLV
ncbi:MAG: hypothetical protein H7Y09_11645 [Chitinophagaceae bacterium]|nr:hypothetical protein [Anaerolineae bacterium]